MTQYDNTNRWTLNNKIKEKTQDTDRDYGGTINIDGKEYWLNGWIKKGANGTFMSGTVKPKEPKKSDPITSGRNADMDDDIPF